MITGLRRRTVSDVMTRQVHVGRPLTPFKRLVQLIEDNHISAIPIVDDHGMPVGVVSESDLLLKERRHELESEPSLLHRQKRKTERAKAVGVVASEVMTRPTISVRSDTTLPEAARLMEDRKVRRLVVVDERGRLAGIVTRSDLLRVFLRTNDELRDEVLSTVIPSVLLPPMEAIRVTVEWNVVTLGGEVDRKSDVEILTRAVRELDGVVDVVDLLNYRWDDTDAAPTQPASIERTSRAS